MHLQFRMQNMNRTLQKNHEGSVPNSFLIKNDRIGQHIKVKDSGFWQKVLKNIPHPL